MKRTFLVAAALAAMGFAPAGGQEPLPIAVVNVDRFYKNYQPFKDKLAPIQEAVGELDKKIQARQIELETVATQGRKAQPGSPDAQRLQQQYGKLQMELQQFVAKERGELQKREVALLLEVYKLLDEEVKKYAKAKGIKLVIRQQDSSLEENQPQAEILKSLNRGILYEDDLDITDEILKALETREKP